MKNRIPFSSLLIFSGLVITLGSGGLLYAIKQSSTGKNDCSSCYCSSLRNKKNDRTDLIKTFIIPQAKADSLIHIDSKQLSNSIQTTYVVSLADTSQKKSISNFSISPNNSSSKGKPKSVTVDTGDDEIFFDVKKKSAPKVEFGVALKDFSVAGCFTSVEYSMSTKDSVFGDPANGFLYTFKKDTASIPVNLKVVVHWSDGVNETIQFPLKRELGLICR